MLIEFLAVHSIFDTAVPSYKSTTCTLSMLISVKITAMHLIFYVVCNFMFY